MNQGDANAAPDPVAVPARLVRGQVLWEVTRLGSALDWLKWPRSLLVLVVGPGLLLLTLEWRAGRSRQATATVAAAASG